MNQFLDFVGLLCFGLAVAIPVVFYETLEKKRIHSVSKKRVLLCLITFLSFTLILFGMLMIFQTKIA